MIGVLADQVKTGPEAVVQTRRICGIAVKGSTAGMRAMRGNPAREPEKVRRSVELRTITRDRKSVV